MQTFFEYDLLSSYSAKHKWKATAITFISFCVLHKKIKAFIGKFSCMLRMRPRIIRGKMLHFYDEFSSGFKNSMEFFHYRNKMFQMLQDIVCINFIKLIFFKRIWCIF